MHSILCALVNILLASHKCQASCKIVRHYVVSFIAILFFLFFGTHSNTEMLNDTRVFWGQSNTRFFSSLLFLSLSSSPSPAGLERGLGEVGRPGDGDGRDGSEVVTPPERAAGWGWGGGDHGHGGGRGMGRRRSPRAQ